MAAIVQTYSQQSGTTTMLQSARGAPAPGMMAVAQPVPNHSYVGAPNQAPRSTYNAAGMGQGYRNSNVLGQPYAFSTMSGVNQGPQWQQQQHPVYRTSVPSAIPTAPSIDTSIAHRSHRQNASVTNMALLSSYAANHGGSRDDISISQSRTTAASQLRPPQISTTSVRSSQYNGQPSRIGTPSQLSPSLASKSNQPKKVLSTSKSAPNLLAVSQSAGDANIHRRASPDEAMKMRRRSIHSIEATDTSRPALKGGDLPRTESANSAKNIDKSEKIPRIVPLPPKISAHHRNASSDSVGSNPSNHSRNPSGASRNGLLVNGNSSSSSSNASDENLAKNGQAKKSTSSRSSASDGGKRTINPSPLSKPATMGTEPRKDAPPVTAPATSASAAKTLNSPAAQQLAAINQKGAKPKSKTSRLRRAFSFGSAAELREAAHAGQPKDSSESSRSQKDATPERSVDSSEQARIAEAQEAGGIGNNIYGGRYFNSTDNLSISSTASSASIMIRKMGRGVKSRTRSLVGLFRPKVGGGDASAESSPPETSEPTVSMVHVEAEAQRVNVTTDPRDSKPGKGGIGYPHLERNSLDASQVPDLGSERLGSSSTENSASRKSIVGGDRERAEVLAAVRKGILKRSSSPSVRPMDSPDLVVPPGVPTISDSPNSSTPSTPVDDAQSHRRVGPIAIGNEDYFMSALRLRHDTKSRPESPQAAAKRNATFSPRIIFYDTWPSQEYDRRGEIATCNRLTPMLAQQIKEELNSFKMEMEVHENSKIYTHFF